MERAPTPEQVEGAIRKNTADKRGKIYDGYDPQSDIFERFGDTTAVDGESEKPEAEAEDPEIAAVKAEQEKADADRGKSLGNTVVGLTAAQRFTLEEHAAAADWDQDRLDEALEASSKK